MQLTSSAFQNGEEIPKKYTCEGENINPEFAFSGVPPESKSLAFIMYDPDIPQEFKDAKGIPGWDHWSIVNINPMVIGIEENSSPKRAVLGKQTGGDIGYTGPCPPKDKEPPKHRYFFWLYALDVESLDLPEGFTRLEAEAAMEGHVIEKTELMGFYEKSE